MFKMQPSERASSKDKFERLGKSIGELCIYTFHRGKELDGQCRAINLHLLKDLHILILQYVVGYNSLIKNVDFIAHVPISTGFGGGGGFDNGLRVGTDGCFF